MEPIEDRQPSDLSDPFARRATFEHNLLARSHAIFRGNPRESTNGKYF
jgi:hypothetical protein